MDDLTHALSGALIAQAAPSRKKGLTLACVLGALLPDADALLTLYDHRLYMEEHRGFTHSLLGFFPMAAVAAVLAYLWVRKKSDRAPFPWLFGMAAAGLASHLLLDWCTSWGTLFLWPARERFSLDQLFIVDAWYLAILALPLWLGRRFPKRRVVFASCGIALALAYHALAATSHHLALREAEAVRPGASCLALPEPFSPFRWSLFNHKDGEWLSSHLDWLKGRGSLVWNAWREPPITPDLSAALGSQDAARFLRFARVPMWEARPQSDGTTVVVFWDERYRSSYGLLGRANARRFSVRVTVRDGRVLPGVDKNL